MVHARSDISDRPVEATRLSASGGRAQPRWSWVEHGRAIGQDAVKAAVGALIGLVIGLIGLRVVPPGHTAWMIVAPTTVSGSGATGARTFPAGQGPTAAPEALVTFGEGGQTVSEFTRYLELMRTVTVAEELARTDTLMRTIFEREWDGSTELWRPDPGLEARFVRLTHGLIGRESWAPPDAADLSAALRRAVRIEPVGQTAMRRITYRHADRAHALTTLQALHAAADGHLRRAALNRATAQTSHLKDALGRTVVADHRRALAELLAEQERQMLALSAALPFAADVIEPPTAARRADWPNPAHVLPLSVLCGIVLALGWARFRAWTAPAPP